MHRWGMDGWDGSPSQAATVPGYSLGLQCSHSASAPTRSHLTRQLGSWGASELRAEAGIGPEARIALPHRPFANTHEYVHACTAVQVCKSRAQHGGQAASSRPGAEALFWKPFFARPRLSHAHWTTGWPLHPCLLKSLAPPTTIFFPGPHNFISSFQRNAVNACVLAAPRLPTRRALSARLRQPPVLELAARQCLDKPKQPTHQDLYHRSVITAVPCLRLLLLLPLLLPLLVFLLSLPLGRLPMS